MLTGRGDRNTVLLARRDACTRGRREVLAKIGREPRATLQGRRTRGLLLPRGRESASPSDASIRFRARSEREAFPFPPCRSDSRRKCRKARDVEAPVPPGVSSPSSFFAAVAAKRSTKRFDLRRPFGSFFFSGSAPFFLPSERAKRKRRHLRRSSKRKRSNLGSENRAKRDVDGEVAIARKEICR